MNQKSSFHLPRQKAFTLLPLLLLLAGCYPVQAASFDTLPASTATQPVVRASLDKPADLEPQNFSIPPPVEPPVSVAEEPPLRLYFATVEPPPDPISRPPLYEPPLALGLYDHFYFLRPIANDDVFWPTTNYRYGDYYPDTEIVHTGIDIVAERGTPILAAASGKVIWASEGISKGAFGDEDPYGIAVAILHEFGDRGRQIQTIYAHMDRVDVTVGQHVEAGDQLGIVGTTGNTTGPHLHFEVRVEDGEVFVTRNPELWVVPPQGWGVLAARLMKRDGTPFYHLEVKVRSLETDHVWTIRTYGPLSANGDDYYNENLVLSDLPAGTYEVKFKYYWIKQSTIVTVLPGAVTYFSFRNSIGFSYDLPQLEGGYLQPIPANIE